MREEINGCVLPGEAEARMVEARSRFRNVSLLPDSGPASCTVQEAFAEESLHSLGKSLARPTIRAPPPSLPPLPKEH